MGRSRKRRAKRLQRKERRQLRAEMQRERKKQTRSIKNYTNDLLELYKHSYGYLPVVLILPNHPLYIPTNRKD